MKLRFLMLLVLLFTACSSPHREICKKFNLTEEEYSSLEKFLRYIMFHENAIYTLAGSKPLTGLSFYSTDLPEEELREKERPQRAYFLLNRDNAKDLEFYEKLSSAEKEEKALLIKNKDFIYDFERLWSSWEKICHRFPLKKRFLLIKKERTENLWKTVVPHCTAFYDIFFVDVLKTALVIQENYELFKQKVGYDFDPMEVVFELEKKQSEFWDRIQGCESSHLWGLLYGYGKENAFSYFWKGRHLKGLNCSEKEKLFAESLLTTLSCRDRPSAGETSAFSASCFSIPAFASFSNPDPVIAKYETEKEVIRRLYKGKDFVGLTLELLIDL